MFVTCQKHRTCTSTSREEGTQLGRKYCVASLLQPNLADDHLSRHLLTAKTTFLLAFATGERRSGLHALSHDVHFEDTSPTVMHLHFVPDYVPKSWYIRKNKVGVDPIRIPCIGQEV